MLSYLILGPFGTIVHLGLIAIVAYVLLRQRYSVLVAILLALIPELGATVAVIQGAVNLSRKKAWDGGPA